MITLGDRIAEMREVRGLKRYELAEALGVSNSSIGRWERNQATPTIWNIIDLCDIFNVSLDCFFERLR